MDEAARAELQQQIDREYQTRDLHQIIKILGQLIKLKSRTQYYYGCRSLESQFLFSTKHFFLLDEIEAVI